MSESRELSGHCDVCRLSHLHLLLSWLCQEGVFLSALLWRCFSHTQNPAPKQAELLYGPERPLRPYWCDDRWLPHSSVSPAPKLVWHIIKGTHFFAFDCIFSLTPAKLEAVEISSTVPDSKYWRGFCSKTYTCFVQIIRKQSLLPATSLS